MCSSFYRFLLPGSSTVFSVLLYTVFCTPSSTLFSILLSLIISTLLPPLPPPISPPSAPPNPRPSSPPISLLCSLIYSQESTAESGTVVLLCRRNASCSGGIRMCWSPSNMAAIPCCLVQSPYQMTPPTTLAPLTSSRQRKRLCCRHACFDTCSSLSISPTHNQGDARTFSSFVPSPIHPFHHLALMIIAATSRGGRRST